MAINTSTPNNGPSGLPAKVILRPSTPSLKSGSLPQKPTDSVLLRPTTPLKTPRPGSDMAQMLEDLQNNGVVAEAPVVVAQTLPAQPLREPTSDYMARMVDDVKKDWASEAYQVQVNKNGSIALLDESSFYGRSDPQTSAEHHHHAPHGHHQGHQGDVLLSGHLGTEIVENVGHHAHHAVTHVANRAAEHGGEAAQELADVAHQGVEETVHHAVEQTASLGKAAAQHLSTGMQVALGIGTVGAGLLAVPLTLNGVKELTAGIEQKDYEKMAEGVGGVAVGVRSAAAATVMAAMLTTSQVMTQVAGVAAQTLTPLGLVHAGIDTVLGVKDVVKGKTVQGLLKIGFGVAVGAAAVGAGIPATIAALGFLGAKVVHKVVKKNQEKKAAEMAKQTPPVDTARVSEGAKGKQTNAIPNLEYYSDYRGSGT